MKTGYFLVGIKIFGLIIQAFNWCPFSVVNSKNSFGVTSYFANFCSTASLETIVFTTAPVFESFKVYVGAEVALEYVLINIGNSD
jgi:hypothetical protein